MSSLGPFALIKPFNVDPNRFVEARWVFSLSCPIKAPPYFPTILLHWKFYFRPVDLLVKVRFFHHSLPLDVATEESPNKNILHQCRCWLSAQCSTPGDSTCTRNTPCNWNHRPIIYNWSRSCLYHFVFYHRT